MEISWIFKIMKKIMYILNIIKDIFCRFIYLMKKFLNQDIIFIEYI